MCGIAGAINFPLNIPKLTSDLFHRGPDEQTTWQDENLILHHHRLSILDIGGGRQPKHHGPYTIIFNGEIYNHLDVRKKYGLQCKTNSDTETILLAYEKMGSKCLDEFDGMFAFIIYDKRKQEIFIARDRAGKKPIYYYQAADQFVLASELNALRHQIELEPDEEAISQFVRMGYFYKRHTPYKNVYELPSGCFAYVSLTKPIAKVQKWWDINNFYKQSQNVSFSEALGQTDTFLHKAVQRRVESSDLEVGSFLSGGIDSGLVTAIAKEYNASLKTFTVSFEGEYDEAPLAKLVANKYNTDHHEIRITFDNLKNDVEKILTNYGEPFMDSSAIPSYYVSQAARNYLTVILNGDGGDEIFGGYRRYIPFAKYDFFSSGFLLRSFAALAHAVLPASNNKKSKYNFIYRLTDLARKQNLDTYLSSTIDSFEGFEKYLVGETGLLNEVDADFKIINQGNLTGLKKIMNLDFDNILAGDLLVKMDIATMAHSLEGRSPLLSKELIEFIPGLPDSYKIKGSTTKYLLRRLAEKYLPAELINQPKRGFEIPLKKWIDNELNEMIRGYIFSSNSISRNYVQPGFIEDVWNRKIKTGDEKRAKMIWTLFALEVWYKKCYLQNA